MGNHGPTVLKTDVSEKNLCHYAAGGKKKLFLRQRISGIERIISNTNYHKLTQIFIGRKRPRMSCIYFKNIQLACLCIPRIFRCKNNLCQFVIICVRNNPSDL